MTICERCEEYKPLGGTYVVDENGDVVEKTETICSDCESELDDYRRTDSAAGVMWR